MILARPERPRSKHRFKGKISERLKGLAERISRSYAAAQRKAAAKPWDNVRGGGYPLMIGQHVVMWSPGGDRHALERSRDVGLRGPCASPHYSSPASLAPSRSDNCHPRGRSPRTLRLACKQLQSCHGRIGRADVALTYEETVPGAGDEESKPACKARRTDAACSSEERGIQRYKGISLSARRDREHCEMGPKAAPPRGNPADIRPPLTCVGADESGGLEPRSDRTSPRFAMRAPAPTGGVGRRDAPAWPRIARRRVEMKE